MKKALIALALAGSILAGLVGCTDDKTTKTHTTNEQPQVVLQIAGTQVLCTDGHGNTGICFGQKNGK